MSKLLRYYVPSSIIFITNITKDRNPFLLQHDALDIYWETLRQVKNIHHFGLIAYRKLPDHFHWLLQLSNENDDFSSILHSFKRNFTRNYKHVHGITTSLSLWQVRFWDHVIRDERDLERHFDYIHWNPFKHQYVDRPEKWPHSSFLHWYRRQVYMEGWGNESPSTINDMDFE